MADKIVWRLRDVTPGNIEAELVIGALIEYLRFGKLCNEGTRRAIFGDAQVLPLNAV